MTPQKAWTAAPADSAPKKILRMALPTKIDFGWVVYLLKSKLLVPLFLVLMHNPG
jgi:hypothetical protein